MIKEVKRKMVFVEGIAVSGEYVSALKDKTFEVMKAPHYTELPDLDKPGESRRKLVIAVKLSSGEILDYFPNKTSIRTMSDIAGIEMDNWIAKKFEWEVLKQRVRGEEKNILYVIAKREERNGLKTKGGKK